MLLRGILKATSYLSSSSYFSIYAYRKTRRKTAPGTYLLAKIYFQFYISESSLHLETYQMTLETSTNGKLSNISPKEVKTELRSES